MELKMMQQSLADNDMSVPDSKKRTTINVAITPEDKQFLKVYAAKHDTNVAAVIAKYIEILRESE